MTLNHHRAEHLLSAHLDGELLPAETAAVQEHLLDCALCREAYENLRATKEALGQLPVAEPPAEFWRDIREPGGAGWWLPGGAGWWLPGGAGWRQPGVRRPSSPPRARLFEGRRLAWALAAILVLVLAALPMVKGTVERLHATEIGVDLYVREHGLQMSTEPLVDRAFLGLVTSDADLVLIGENPRAGQGR